ncbi:hypothetical protein C4568_04285 [Candidatus Parcubacteria bacterium]|jgi:hypothetical protein|nr:MAG: hypothetical protein C4568_04285 [Candidatus Parcubacteria bacterium]
MHKNKITQHILSILAITVLLVLIMVYPFLPGGYDRLALSFSTMIQTGGAFGLLLIPIGILWLLKPRQAYAFARAAAVIGMIIAIIVSLIAFFTIGASFGFIMVAFFAYMGWKFWPRLKLLKNSQAEQRSLVPLYLIAIPATLVLVQVFFAGPLTDWSRDRAIANSAELIDHIENYRTQYGRYPESLLAQHKDYYPDVVGVEEYHYSPQGESYNFFFENPQFIFKNIGTREWIVYNPQDEHRMYSHTAWYMLLTPEEQERGQGWYETGDVGVSHWKYFWFD